MAERWRTGRSVGRTIYLMTGEVASKDDVLIGVMDTPELAAKVVAAVTMEQVQYERAVARAGRSMRATLNDILDDPIMHSPLGEQLVRVDDVRAILIVRTPGDAEEATDG